MNVKKAQAEIDKRIKALGKERDKIDELQEELSMAFEAASEAIGALEDARDALSTIV